MFIRDRGDICHPIFFLSNLFNQLNDPALYGGARTIVHRHLSEATLIPVDDSGVLADIDTPESYEYALQNVSDSP